jgi:hypothetical protein
MATRDFSKYFLYRWRYVIGYSLIGLLLAGLLLFAGLYLPGGISTTEMNSVVRSASLNFNDPATLAMTSLPYYTFQAGIFALFGVSIFTIKLPSLILGLVSAIGLILLLRRWFKPNIAVLTSLIAISTGQFLFISQSGVPSILYIFWPIALLLLGTQITRGKKFRFLWKLLFAITAGLSLYTPLSIYPVIAILLATILHPHLRATVRRLRRLRLVAVLFAFLVTIAPLVYFIVLNPTLGLQLLGIPIGENWPPDLGANALTVLQQYFLFWDPSFTTVATPVFGLASALLISIGLIRLIRTRDTTRSYLVIIWIICLVPVLLLNPIYTSVTFVPSMLMLAAGLTSLIGYWYRLFPLNPYARVSGLVPIVILVGTLIVTGLVRYGYGYHYSTSLATLYSNDLRLLPSDTTQLVVGDDERDFYEAVSQANGSTYEVVSTPTADSATVTREANEDFKSGEYSIERIITSARSNESDRFYVYQRGGE